MIYLASPYWHSSKEVCQTRMDMACAWLHYFTKAAPNALSSVREELRTLPIFSPIAHNAPSVHHFGELLLDKLWKLDLLMVNACTDLVILPFKDWQESKGVLMEIGAAFAMGKRVWLQTEHLTARLSGPENVYDKAISSYALGYPPDLAYLNED